MREIEFRAYLHKEKKIVDVKSIHFGTRKIMYGYSKNKQSYGNKSCKFDDIDLMQYTGLKDKNGKKIFEGDIVKLDNQLLRVVYECASFGLGSNKGINYNPIINKSKETGSMDFWGCYCDNFVSLFELYWNFNDDENILSEIEIIGNIYDNQELLRGE